MRTLPRRRKAALLEFAIPTINIVFLLLLFFIFAGSQSTGVELAVAPPETARLAPDRLPRPLLTLDADGRLFLDGAPIDAAALGPTLTRRAADGRLRRLAILAERTLPAHRLLDLVRTLKGTEGLADLPVVIVTEPAGSAGRTDTP